MQLTRCTLSDADTATLLIDVSNVGHGKKSFPLHSFTHATTLTSLCYCFGEGVVMAVAPAARLVVINWACDKEVIFATQAHGPETCAITAHRTATSRPSCN
jgi:hypothetical protein